ncbi:MAG: hypothetical protein H7279_08295 [Microbacteriaceae bacterium]|nr:hypothetical protein [Microbacteriaceae bacterium]
MMKFSTIMVRAGAVVTMFALTGCSSPNGAAPAPEKTGVAFEHIHELEVNHADGSLLVATHKGLYRLTVSPAGKASATGPVGGLDFDPMGFSIAGDTAYASGHPGPTTPDTFGTPNLGLITSADAGATWTNVSLTGKTDFHGLTVMAGNGAADRVFGMDSSKKQIQRSMNGGLTWSDGATLIARDILAVGDSLYATTQDGLVVSNDNATTFTVDATAPALYLVAADRAGTLAGIDTSGTVWARGAEGTWTKGGTVTGTPQAFTVDGNRLYVADDRGISVTDDVGATWTVLSAHS